MPFRWRGVSALSWFPDERTSLELGHVPRLALFITHNSVLQNVGPLPATCACSTIHPSLRGLATKGGFKSFFARSLGPRFWARILNKIQDSQLPCSLRDGASSVPSSSAGTISSDGNSVYGFALSAAPESVSALYEAWKSNTLTRTLLRDFSASRLDSFFESRGGLARNTVFLFSLLSPACKFLESRRAVRAVPGFSGMSSPVVPSVLLCYPVSPDIGHATHPGSSSIFSGGGEGVRQFCLALQLSTEREVLSTVRHLSQLARHPSSFLSLTCAGDSRTSQLARLPSIFLSLTCAGDFPATSRSERKSRMESDGRVWEQHDTLDATGEPASIRGIGLSSTSSPSP